MSFSKHPLLGYFLVMAVFAVIGFLLGRFGQTALRANRWLWPVLTIAVAAITSVVMHQPKLTGGGCSGFVLGVLYGLGLSDRS